MPNEEEPRPIKYEAVVLCHIPVRLHYNGTLGFFNTKTESILQIARKFVERWLEEDSKMIAAEIGIEWYKGDFGAKRIQILKRSFVFEELRVMGVDTIFRLEDDCDERN